MLIIPSIFETRESLQHTSINAPQKYNHKNLSLKQSKSDSLVKSSATSQVDHNALLNSLFDSTFEQSSLGQALIDARGNLLRVNKKLIELTGYSFNDMADQYFKYLTASEEYTIENQFFQLLNIKEAETSPKKLLSFHRPNGKEIHVLTSISQVYDHEGELSFYVKSFEDITELKHSETQIRRLAQEFDHFVYRAFHDLQGPLSSIEGVCNIMKLSNDNPETSRYVDMIGTVTIKMKKALLGMLEAAKINDLKTKESSVDFENLVDNLLNDIAKLPEFQSIRLGKHVQPNIRFRADPSYLNIIIKHLLENAVIFQDHLKNEAWVKLEIFQNESDKVKIRVSDNGLGVEETDQEEVFQMFCRKSLRSKGAGIGLYLVKQSVERLGGNILLCSQPGEGTVVEVTL